MKSCENKVLIGIGAAALLIGGLFLITGINKNENDIVVPDEEQVESSSTEELPLVSEDGVNLTMTEENLSKVENFMNSAGDMRIIKTITFFEENKETNELLDIITLDRKILCNYPSEDFFIATDALKVMEDTEYLEDASNYEDIFKKHTIDMKEHFGIDIETLVTTEKNYDILLKIAEAYNIDTTTFVDSRLNKELYDVIYKIEKQKLYYCDVTEKFDVLSVGLTEKDYDKILDIKTQLLTNEVDGNEYISYLIVTVDYEKDEIKYTRELNFALSFFGDAMGDCNCADDSGCNTGTNDPCEEDCEMEDKIE